MPENINICFEFIEGESLLLSLDMEGIAGSSGSACTSEIDPSHVLLAIDHPMKYHGSLRLSLEILIQRMKLLCSRKLVEIVAD